MVDIQALEGQGAAPLAAGLTAAAADRIQASQSVNTRRAYRSAWAAWAAQRGIPALPASPETLAAYFADRAQTVGVSAIRRRPS